ncbi:MAG: radical SAM protein [Candidatus Omnitrophota bacterium]
MEIKIIQTQKALSPTQIQLADYVINPYRGCEFGCLYCYSQENKNIKNMDFFNSLCVKINIADVLRQQLQYTRPKRVLLGSTTECFQYQEAKYGLTRQMLEILNAENIPYTILTKSHLIKKDLSIIAKNRENKIYFTLNFASDDIIKLFENNSSLLKMRLETIEEILKNKIQLRIHIGPFMPYVSILKKIIKLIPSGTREIDIELYHKKMGNFKKISALVEEKFGKETKDMFCEVYRNKETYADFTKKLTNEIAEIEKNNPAKFFCILPDFNEFYNKGMDYNEKTVF